MKGALKLYPVLLFIFIAAADSSAGQARSNPESEAYPKGYYHGDKLPEKTVYLTFDDGPSEWTGDILDILKEQNVKATFFISAYWNNRKMTGRNSFQRHRRELQRMTEEGHVIGNHTSGHRVLTALSGSEIKRQFNHNQEILNSVLGKNAPVMTLIRPPLGRPWTLKSSVSRKKYVGSIVRSIGIVSMWSKEFDSTDAWDWAKGEWYRSGARIDRKNPSCIKKQNRMYNRIVSRADGRGMVILMHDTHSVTRDILASIIEDLKKKGYRFCTMEDYVQWKYGKSSRELIELN